MLDHTHTSNNVQSIFLEECEGKFRKPYHAPCLEELGDLRAVTLGGSPGSGDSGIFYCEKTTGLHDELPCELR